MNTPRVALVALLTSLAATGGGTGAARERELPAPEADTPSPAVSPSLPDLSRTKKEVAAGALSADSLFALMSEGNAAGYYTEVAEIAEIALGTPPGQLGPPSGAPPEPPVAVSGGVSLYRDDYRIYNEAGVAYYMTNRVAAAKWAYEEAIRLNPRTADPWANLGLLYRRKGRYEEALAYYDRALEVAAASATTWYNRGVCLLRLGRLPESIKSFETAAAISPKYPSPLRRLALLWFDVGDYNAAASYAEKYEYLVRTDVASTPGQKEEAARFLDAIRKRLAASTPLPPSSPTTTPRREPSP